MVLKLLHNGGSCLDTWSVDVEFAALLTLFRSWGNGFTAARVAVAAGCVQAQRSAGVCGFRGRNAEAHLGLQFPRALCDRQQTAASLVVLSVMRNSVLQPVQTLDTINE